MYSNLTFKSKWMSLCYLVNLPNDISNLPQHNSMMIKTIKQVILHHIKLLMVLFDLFAFGFLDLLLVH